MATKTDVLRVKLERSGDGQLRASIAGIGDETDNLADKTKNATGEAQLLRNTLAGLAGALSVGAVARTIVEFERLQASLVTVTGSAREADIAFSLLKDFATTTPFQLEEITDAFIKLKALGLDPSEDALQSYGNTAAAMGKSLNQFIEAVADASTGEFERLKEFGIRARVQGEQVAFTFRNMTTVVGKNATEIEAFLRKIGQTDFSGAMERQMETLGGSFSNLQDAASQFAAALGEAGLSSALKSAASFLTFMANEGKSLTQIILPLVSGLAAAKILGPIFGVVAARASLMTTAFRSAAGAAGLLRAGLAFLGGPAGIVFGVATALSFFASQASIASVDTEELSSRVKALTGDYRSLKQEQIEQTISDVTLAIQQYQAEIKKITDDANSIGQPLGNLDTLEINERIEKIKELATSLQALQAQLTKTNNREEQPQVNDDPFGDKSIQREAERQLQKLEAFRLSQLTEQELLVQSELEKQAIVQGFFNQGLIDAEEYFEQLERIESESAERRKAIESDVNDVILQFRFSAYQQLANLARSFAGESRAAALAALAIEKGLAIAQTFINTEVAAAKARAALIVPGDPSSVIRAEAQAQRIRLQGRLAAVAIGATGLAQASQVGSGGASAGSPANPISTQPANTTPVGNGQQQGTGEVVNNVYILGNIYSREDFDRQVEIANRNLSDQDREVVQRNSRNALDLRDF